MGLQPLGLPLSLQEARRDEIAPLINNKREALERKEKAEKKMPLSLEMQELALGQKLLISEWRTELLTLRLQLHLTSK